MLVVVGVLVTLLGVVVVLLSLLALQHPVWRGGETGRATESTGPLVALLGLGVAMVAGGAGTAAILVRAQLRDEG